MSFADAETSFLLILISVQFYCFLDIHVLSGTISDFSLFVSFVGYAVYLHRVLSESRGPAGKRSLDFLNWVLFLSIFCAYSSALS